MLGHDPRLAGLIASRFLVVAFNAKGLQVGRIVWCTASVERLDMVNLAARSFITSCADGVACQHAAADTFPAFSFVDTASYRHTRSPSISLVAW
jgi:hypothetical protein